MKDTLAGVPFRRRPTWIKSLNRHKIVRDRLAVTGENKGDNRKRHRQKSERFQTNFKAVGATHHNQFQPL